MQFQPVIRWNGGKRRQSEDIVNQFPQEMDTMWIPFLGGGSIMYQMLNSNIKFKRMIVSDIYDTLMQVWGLIKNDPQRLLDGYAELVSQHSKKFYQTVVDRFNDEGGTDPMAFYYILRACGRGGLQYDRYGNFISKLSEGDRPSVPKVVEPILMRWHEAIQHVEFRCESYEEILLEVQPEDYVFLDPPYIDGTWYKHHDMDWDKFWNFLRTLPCDWSMTLNGDKDTYPIPNDLYTNHAYVYYGVSTTSFGTQSGSRDSLWMNHGNGIYVPNAVNCRQNGRLGGGKANTSVEETKTLFQMHDRVQKLETDMGEIKGVLGQILNAIQGGNKYNE